MQKGNACNSFEDAQRREDGGVGDADNVQKTTWVAGGGGTDPDKDQSGAPVIASVPSGGGINVGAWAVGIIALVIALIYAAGVFR